MKVTVLRQPSEKDWTLSKFYFDGVQKGFGVEDEKRTTKLKGETCIPDGEYEMVLRNSPKFSGTFYRNDSGLIMEAKLLTTESLKKQYHTPHELVWVKDVPGFEFILWHWGNTDDDTDGCYIVGGAFGNIEGQKGVVASRSKYKEIYPILWNEIHRGTVKVEYKTTV